MTVDRTGGGRSGAGMGQKLFVVGGVLVVLALTFVLGVLVGRGWHRPVATVLTEPERTERKAAPARRSGLVETVVQKPGDQGRLTFYQTLTAPAAPAAPSGSPAKGRGERPAAGPSAGPAPAPGAAPATPPAGSPAAPAASARPEGWSVQVGAFRTRAQADGVQRQLTEAGLSAFVSGAESDPGQTRFRVRVGAFRTRAEAERAAERLRTERGLPTFVATN